MPSSQRTALPSRLPRTFMAALLLTGISFQPSAALADTLVDNIKGFSFARDGSVQRFTGMVIGNDGTIRRILTDKDDKPGPVDFRHDGRGRTVIPGFVDGHVHLMDLGLSRMILDLTPARTLEEAQARLSAYAAAHPDRPWLIGRGWDDALWAQGRLPTAADIDSAVGERPVLLTRQDGEMAWASSAALRAAGITAQTPDPTGGKIERLPGSRTPSGILIGTAIALAASKVPPPRASDRDIALHEAQELLLANGVTTVADMGTSVEDWMTYRRAGDTGRLRLRILSYADNNAAMLLIGGTGPTPWLYEDRLRMGGVHLVIDGGISSRSALLNAPYADSTGASATSGLAQLDGTQLRNLVSRAAMDDFQVAIHAAGDRAVAEFLGTVEDLADDYKGDRRWRLEQADLIAPEDLSRLSGKGIAVSFQPASLAARYPVTEARLGAERAAQAFPWNAVYQTRAAIAFGSGAPSAAPSPFAGLAAAISRTDSTGSPEGGWNAAQALPLEHALAAYTAGAAYAAFAETKLGQLREGLRADFLMIDGDITQMDADKLRDLAVAETWVGGVQRYAAGRSGPAAPAPRRTEAEDLEQELERDPRAPVIVSELPVPGR